MDNKSPGNTPESKRIRLTEKLEEEMKELKEQLSRKKEQLFELMRTSAR